MPPSLSSFDDEVLIRLTLEGRTDCFAVLMDRHMVAVRRHIWAIAANESDADDLTQEVQLKVWRCLAQFRAESSFRTWVIRVAVNQALQLRRKEKCRPSYVALDDFPSLVSGSESPHQSLVRVEELEVLHRAVANLPPMYRQVLTLRLFDELSVRETADELQWSIPAVKTRLVQARLLLSDELQRSNVTKLARAA